ncbi:uncharacterized protein LOC131659983 [Vicia villosa]|uniref:uncharacterized protein LOC131659983 n=1 Tax=Vicia villosa TaxID=3911 RepID=UPI00273C57BC|nr:uncharacterized protein LOC131659983 [Vicia villosa]
MDASANTVKEFMRRTSSYMIPVIDVSGLISLSSCLKGKVLQDFNHDYVNLLSILHTSFDPMALITLFHFYDPQLRSFTFQDYQLVPTLEEYSYNLNIRITDNVPFFRVSKVVRFENIAEALHVGIKEVKYNWKSTGATPGFNLCFLINKAEESAKKEHWDEFSRLLAVMIYDIVLFPSTENFVSLLAICVFMNENPVPPLLADTYVAIHSRHGKGGYVVGSCLPLLYQWFMLHMPVKGPFVLKKGSLQWSDMLLNLTSFDIRWNYCVGKVWNIITSCGQYSNVPVIGTRGCINCNPMLAYLQLGYAMEGPPKDAEIAESVYFADGTVSAELYTQAKADNIKLQVKDREVDLESYFLDQEKGELAHKLKQAQGESSGMTGAQRRSYDLMEESLYRKQQKCLKLQRTESNGKRKIRDLEKQLMEEKGQVSST